MTSTQDSCPALWKYTVDVSKCSCHFFNSFKTIKVKWKQCAEYKILPFEKNACKLPFLMIKTYVTWQEHTVIKLIHKMSESLMWPQLFAPRSTPSTPHPVSALSEDSMKSALSMCPSALILFSQDCLIIFCTFFAGS